MGGPELVDLVSLMGVPDPVHVPSVMGAPDPVDLVSLMGVPDPVHVPSVMGAPDPVDLVPLMGVPDPVHVPSVMGAPDPVDLVPGWRRELADTCPTLAQRRCSPRPRGTTAGYIEPWSADP
jgi:hypothetical protein